ncbi:MAG: bifunctional YncE family protein/alkaline phosphatase family protein [Bryobacteraceae bacterium]
MQRKTWLCLITSLAFASLCRNAGSTQESATLEALLPTGKRITPTAAPGSHFQMLNPGLKAFPDFVAGQAISTAVSPDQKTLLILTSGFNRINGADGNPIPDASEEYVFAYDVSHGEPQQVQVVKVPDTFAGIAFSPDSKQFYVSGGKDDNIHIFSLDSSRHWSENGEPIKLGHSSGLGLQIGKEPLAAGGLAVTQNGEALVVANVYNDSVSVVDLQSRRVAAELDLRPGKIDAADAGVPGGEYPFWVSIKGNTTAYVSSLRDREIVVVGLARPPSVLQRIKIAGNPNKMLLNRDQSRLFVTADNSDNVVVIDTKTNRILEALSTVAPAKWMAHLNHYTGGAPNSLALSPDEQTLYVTNGGSNSVAVIRLGRNSSQSSVTGLLPTGWYPNSVSVSGDGRMLYIVNGKSVPGPNRDLHVKVKNLGSRPGPAVVVNSHNQYILQMEKAGFLSVPVPGEDALERLTRIVARNNSFGIKSAPQDAMVMSELHHRIKHVIYIIKENRTYDQILGDLDRGNGDPSLTEFGARITPNFHNIARQFVDLDNFYNSGEVSGDGWPWSTSARESDFGEKAVVLQYANRGTNYEYEGLNRDLNVGLKTLSERKAANPKTPSDPDLLPGTINVAEPDGPHGSPRGKGYIWDAALRAGLTFREYGCMSDTTLDAPREPYPFKARIVVSRPANPELYKYGDPYFRGFDPGYPDFYREAEWEREFNEYVANSNLPAFEIVELPVDHMGEFETAISGVNTPELQQSDNDYATALLIQRVAHSPYKDSTLIFSIEDDSQDGPDHVDAHRTTAYVVGPYVKHSAVVSSYYTTVNMIRTIENVLGLEHLNLNTATARPMTDVFDLRQKEWSFDAVPSAVLGKTRLPITDFVRKAAQSGAHITLAHDVAYWAAKTANFDFGGEDRVDPQEFNRIIWEGLMRAPYPTTRSHLDLRSHREKYQK